jgi:hypothetical protein
MFLGADTRCSISRATKLAGAFCAAISGMSPLPALIGGVQPVFAADLVASNYGSVFLDAYSGAYTIVGRDPDPVIFTDNDTDNDIFILAPRSLSADVSVRSIAPLASSSFAGQVNADWTSADHGTVAFNTISSISVGPIASSDPISNFSEYQLNPLDTSKPINLFPEFGNDLWLYNFTPNVDVVLTLDAEVLLNNVSDNTDYAINQFSFYLNQEFLGTTTSNFNKSINLLAGQDYTIRLQPRVYSFIGNAPEFDSLTISSLNLAFDITAASGPPDPGGGGTGGVPEPAIWEMMLLGFGAAGFAMRSHVHSRSPNSLVD